MNTNNSFSVVTTFNNETYKVIASNMVKSFDKFWDKNISLFAYYEDMNWPIDKFSERINLLSFNDLIKDWYVFRDNFKGLESIKLDNDLNSFYKYSATKFAHKVYTIKHQLKKCETDYLIWLDSDILTINDVKFDLLKKLVKKESYLSYLGREHIQFHSECGFLIFNIRHKSHQDFWNNMSQMYDKGGLFKEKEWHDSYIFDLVRIKMEKNGYQNLNISSLGLKKTHDTLNVFDNSILGDFMIHFKGNRKFNYEAS